MTRPTTTIHERRNISDGFCQESVALLKWWLHYNRPEAEDALVWFEALRDDEKRSLIRQILPAWRAENRPRPGKHVDDLTEREWASVPRSIPRPNYRPR